MHELDVAAGLEPLARILKTGAAILVASKAPARELAVTAHHDLVITFRPTGEAGVARLLPKHARLTKTLGDVDIMPVHHVVAPASHVAMNLVGKLEQELLPRPIIEPVGGLDVVPETEFGPIAVAE